MLKQEFINLMRGKLRHGTKKDCEEFLNAFEQTVGEVLADGGEVKLSGFGTFKTRGIAAHEGTDPRTKERIKIPSVVIPAFSAGSALTRTIRSKME